MTADSDPLSLIDAWLAGHRRFVAAAVILVSIALRASAFAELARGPFLSMEQWTETDMNYYDGWGRAIAHGDWLSASVGVPMHPWQVDLARTCLDAHPSTETEAQVWWDWNGSPTFYDDALYSYLVGLTYSVGESPHAVIAWQLILGVLTNVLIVVIARDFFGDLTALVAGALAVACSTLLHYELLLLRDSVVVFAVLGLVWLGIRIERRNTALNWALFGCACGFAILLKSTIAVLVAMLIVGMTSRLRQQSKNLLGMLAGFVPPLGLVVLRNALVGGSLFQLSGNGPITFVTSNNAAYPTSGGFSIDVARVGSIMCDTHGRFLPAVVATLRTRTAASIALLFWHKFVHVWSWYEVPNNANFYYLRLHSAVLEWLPVTFFLLAPLGLVGLVLAWRDRRRAWALYAVVVWIVGILTVFLVLGRLRAVLVAAMIPFAAFTIVRVLRSTRPWPIVAALLAVWIWTGRPLPAGQSEISATDWFTPYWVTYEVQVTSLAGKGDTAGAARALGEFLKYEPDFADMDRSNGQLVEAGDRDAARAFARVHAKRADFLERSGQPGEAEAERVRSASLVRLSGAPIDR